MPYDVDDEEEKGVGGGDLTSRRAMKTLNEFLFTDSVMKIVDYICQFNRMCKFYEDVSKSAPNEFRRGLAMDKWESVVDVRRGYISEIENMYRYAVPKIPKALEADAEKFLNLAREYYNRPDAPLESFILDGEVVDPQLDDDLRLMREHLSDSEEFAQVYRAYCLYMKVRKIKIELERSKDLFDAYNRDLFSGGLDGKKFTGENVGEKVVLLTRDELKQIVAVTERLYKQSDKLLAAHAKALAKLNAEFADCDDSEEARVEAEICAELDVIDGLEQRARDISRIYEILCDFTFRCDCRGNMDQYKAMSREDGLAQHVMNTIMGEAHPKSGFGWAYAHIDELRELRDCCLGIEELEPLAEELAGRADTVVFEELGV